MLFFSFVTPGGSGTLIQKPPLTLDALDIKFNPTYCNYSNNFELNGLSLEFGMQVIGKDSWSLMAIGWEYLRRVFLLAQAERSTLNSRELALLHGTSS